jgi:xanthine/uracil/vitamin C permease (AzgA family)
LADAQRLSGPRSNLDIRQIDFEDYLESVPSFAIVALTCFTFNIAIGITAGFVLYPLCKLVAPQVARDPHQKRTI